MKKLSIILAFALVALTACTKSKEVHPEIGDGNDEIVTVGMKEVHVEYTRTDHAELNHVVFHYCPADANGNAQQFDAAEMTKKETFFELVLDELLCDTLYWYYYELFPNSGDAFNSVQKTFHTQACDTPEPPEPPTPPSGTPEGAINGLFTINNEGKQVYFSQGNLQYIGSATMPYWKFADNQWDYLGYNGQGSSNHNADRDLFLWGTSGFNHGAVCYQPWSTSPENSDYYAYGSMTANLYDQTGEADWGYNKIQNGGNQFNQWRTLSCPEWDYILFTRNTMSGIRFVKAQVLGVNGIMILPDNWNASYYSFNNANQSDGSYDSNIIAVESVWLNQLQSKGVVFLCSAGNRSGITTEGICGVGWCNSIGFYWSSSFYTFDDAYSIEIRDDGMQIHPNSSFINGFSVRLVQDANK